jgi:glycosyltransferase involved in cell wall biosynthesis
MALGKPVVAGAEGGPSEIITDGVTGLLSPYGDPAALAAAVSRILGDPALAARLGAAAQKRAQDFDGRRYATQVISALRESVAP